MARSVVNLDAMIPREDFAVHGTGTGAADSLNELTISNLRDAFFAPSLRKPDFQRETTNWSPQKVVELIKAFVDRDLIPAVILWRTGSFTFVIDGAHRLSALLAWIHDDYGDRKRSIDYFGGHMPPEQERIAQRTRELIRKEIGSFAELEAKGHMRDTLDDINLTRVNNIGTNKIIVQWVSAGDADAAEKSFFKINQEATPLDPVEKRILWARDSANAVAARAITRAGTGHQYWGSFSPDIQKQIVDLGRYINNALYKPPLAEGHIRSVDVPVAGQGYNILPFVFDLVNLNNDPSIAFSSNRNVNKDDLPKDEDGSKTIQYLQKIKRSVDFMTGDGPSSFGFHPIIYFYTLSGAFQPAAFFAMMQIAPNIANGKKAMEFREIRSVFEQYIREHKGHITDIVHNYGSGNKSIRPIRSYFEKIIDILFENPKADISDELKETNEFSFLFSPRPRATRGISAKGFNRTSKSAAFIQQAYNALISCGICGGAVHTNSMQMDHKARKSEGGGRPHQPFDFRL